MVATYSGLRVTDATADSVPATMAATSGGSVIEISVHDAHATYPLTIDPTWIEVEEFTSADSTTKQFGGPWVDDDGTEYQGTSIAMSGTDAFIGAVDTLGGVRQGVVYAFIQNSSGLWVQQSELTANDAYSGSGFGTAIAVSGSTLVIGDPLKTESGHTNQGAVYVFSGTGSGSTSNWTQAAEFTSTNGAVGDFFGLSVAVSGSTIAVGAPTKTVGSNSWQGEAYVFSGSGSSWSQAATVTSSDGLAYDEFGLSVAIASGAVAVGAPYKSISGGGTGAVYMFNSPSYTQSAEFDAAYDVIYLGTAITAGGNAVIAGAPESKIPYYDAGAGSVLIYTESGTTWSQAVTLDSPNPSNSQFFGSSLSLSGTMLAISAESVDGEHGQLWVATGSGSSWTAVTTGNTYDATEYDQFGNTTATNGTVALAAARSQAVGANSGQGVVYAYNTLGVVPTGIAYVNMEAAGGGSPSEPCQLCAQQTASGVPTVDTKGDPVNTASGDFYETATDLTLPGAGVPLSFTRTYDAQGAQAEVAASAAAGPLGYGWTDNLNMSVSYNSTTQVATVTEENGSQTTYVPYVSGTSPAWCNGATNFCAQAPRMEASLNHNSGGSWTFTRQTSSPITFQFNSSGQLTQISDAQGDSLTASTYSPTDGQTSCPSGDTCTAWTSSASGRELVLAVDSSNQLVEVFDANSSLAATFTYSGTGCSSWSGSETPDLCSAVDPGSITATYTYDSGNASADFDYDMLTATPPGGASGQTTNTYNTNGQVAQQTDPTGQVTTYTYAGTNSATSGGTTTITTYPDGTGTGEPTDVTLDTYSSDTLVLETTGYGTAAAQTVTITRDPNSLLPLTVTDGDGNVTTDTYQTYSGTGGGAFSSGNMLTKTDGAGNVTQHAYSTTDQLWCTVDPADYANGTRCPSTEPTSPPAPGTNDPYLGAAITFYNASGLPTATTDALGNTTTISYTSGVSGVPNNLPYCAVDPVNYQASVTCPAYGASHVTGTTTATYDAAGDKLTSTNADGDTTTYAYAYGSTHPGLVSSKTDPSGTTTTYTYNGAGEVTDQAVSFGSATSTTLNAYDSYGRLYCTVDPLEAAQGVTCPTSPPSPSSPPANLTSTFYDADGRVIQSTNPLGGTSITAYDGSGLVYCTVSPAEYAASVRCPSSEPTTPPTVGSDPYVGATITTYDAAAQVVQVTNPLGGIELSTYDPAGNLTSTTTESNNATAAPNVVTAYGYDADDRVISTTVGSGSSQPETTLKAYDPNGNVFCTVSPKAYAQGTSAYQCPTWQASWVAAPPSPTSLYSSTPTSAQADNVTTAFSNAQGTVVQSSTPDVATTVSALDPDARTYCTSDPTNVAAYLTAHPSATYPYNCPTTPPTTPPTTGSNPGYVTTIYDPTGLVLDSSTAAGDTTASTYDAAGDTLTTTDPRGEVTTNCYYDQNASGQCAHSAPAGGGIGTALYSTTTPATSADPSGETSTYTYFAGGALDISTTPGATATDAYDAAGDLTSTTYSGIGSGYSTPANTSATYNVDGATHTVTDATGTSTYGYDAMGDVTSQALVATGGLANATTSYSYYTTGAKSTVTYPAYTGYSNPVVTYTYDPTGAMATSTDWLGNEITYSHDADGNTTNQANHVSTSNPNGTSSTASTYDNADLPTAATTSINQTCGGSENVTQSFSGSTGSRNPDGQLTAETTSYSATCSGQTTSTLDYSYDTAGQVTYQGTTTQGSSANNFGYDASGDPTTLSAHSGASLDTYTQTFDAAGEVTSQTPIAGSGGSTTDYSYDTLGAQIQATGGTSATYAYNGAGQMASATTSNGSTSYLYNAEGLEAAATKAGTTTWGTPADVNSTRAIDATTCVSSTFCVAVGASGYITIYNGTSWSTPVDADSTRTLDAVSCTSSSFCVAVDTSGYATIYNGTSWSTPSDIDSSRSVNSVTCISTTFCMAVGASGYAAKYTGSWASATDIDSTRALSAIACTSSSFCIAVGASGYAAKYTGSWASATDIDSSRSISAVSCVSTTFCVAVDASGYAAKYTGSWASATDVDSTRAIKALACPSSTLCVAVDASGYGLTYNGSTWATPVDADGSRALDTLSCASTTFCVAADTTGYATAYNGTSWSTPTDIDVARSVSSVSCASSTFCAAADTSGYATLYATGPSSTAQLIWDLTSTLPNVLSDGTYDYLYGPGGTPVEEIALATSSPTYMSYTPSDSTWVSTNEAGDLTGLWSYDAFGTLATSTVANGTPTSSFGYAGQYTDPASGFSVLRARDYYSATGTFTTRDPAFRSTDTAYTYAGDDPVNGSDPMGLNSEPSSSEQDDLLGLLESISSNSAISGEAPTLGNELSMLAGEYGSLQECMQIQVGDPDSCFATPGRLNLSQYLNGGGSTCLLTQITSEESSGHAQAAALIALASFGIVVRVSSAGPVQPYEVGTYSELKARSVVGDGLDIHHLPQANPAEQVIEGYSAADGPAIALPAAEHGTIPTIRGTYSGSAQDLLDLGIEDLRAFTNAPEGSIQQIQALNAESFPDDFDIGLDF